MEETGGLDPNVVLLIIVPLVLMGVVTDGLKGRMAIGFFGVGIVVFQVLAESVASLPLAILYAGVALFTPARADSIWAREFLDEEDRKRARERDAEEDRKLKRLPEALPYECAQCGTLFDDRHAAVAHVERSHPGTDPEALVVLVD